MAKQLGVGQGSSAFEQINQIRTELSQIGLDPKRIDEMLVARGGVDEILKDNQLLSQYFKKVAFALGELTEWKYDDDKDRSLSSEIQEPQAYTMYFQEPTDISIPHQTHFPSKELFNYQGMVKGGYLNLNQAKALKSLVETGLNGVPNFLKQTMGMNLNNLPQTSQNSLPPPATEPVSDPGSEDASGASGDYLTRTNAFPNAPGYDESAASGSDIDYSNYYGSPTQYERDLMGDLPLDPVLNSFFEVMFGKSDMARGVTASIMEKMQRKREARKEIVAMMQKLDPTDPKQAMQLRGLQEQLNDFDSSIQMDYSDLTQAKAFEDQMKQFINKMAETYLDTQKSIIRNMA